jgi:hypothetical protein
MQHDFVFHRGKLSRDQSAFLVLKTVRRLCLSFMVKAVHLAMPRFRSLWDHNAVLDSEVDGSVTFEKSRSHFPARGSKSKQVT